ncbi:MAG TPA: Hsp20/alpha crystallin family protein [Candidatus Saccharimonadales bacterium]|nr:Hsp20/alpha crystallin family protein [Candidatus Saccharimonadales bacterium]
MGVAIGVVGMLCLGPGKSASPPSNQIALSAPSLQIPTNMDQWNPFQEIQNMQAQMDQSFNEMFQQFRTHREFDIFQGNPNYSLSLNLQDLKDRYEVRAFLPDTKNSDVNVTLENGRTMKVTVNNKQTDAASQTNGMPAVTEWGHYEQVIDLPTPGNAEKMTVQRKGDELIITIPKVA